MSKRFSTGPWKLKAFTGGFSISESPHRSALACVPSSTADRFNDEQTANALLISQAPKLLESLLSIEQSAMSGAITEADLLREVGEALGTLRNGGLC